MTHSSYGTKLVPAMIDAPIQAAYKTGMTSGTCRPASSSPRFADA